MSNSINDSHRRAAELHDGAAHLHRVAERHGKQEHLDGHERTREALEHSGIAHRQTREAMSAHGIFPFGHLDIAALAHELWHARGCPEGTPQQDWFHAAEQLRSRAEKAVTGKPIY